MNKLFPIAELIKELLELEFRVEATYGFEEEQDWPLNVPDRELYKEFWEDISTVYNKLIDNRWTLDDKLNSSGNNFLGRKAKIDIWFNEPYNFICEFDESQHFNQFRLITLENGYNDLNAVFDLNLYRKLSSKRLVHPGTSGFNKLSAEDFLFPKMYEGINQDNRIRQRAFRDYIKDIVPIKLGYNPTIRISYKVTNNHIKNFTEGDINRVKNYLYINGLLNKVKLM
jgi:hypothetical protein